MFGKTTHILLISAFICVSTHPVWAIDAEEKVIPDSSLEKSLEQHGWVRYLGIGLYGTINENDNVVGKDDGQSTTGGLKLQSSLDFKEQQHQWLNSFNLILAFSRTPQIPRYIKSEDSIELESIYKYYLLSPQWLGAFAQFKADTVAFDGYDTQASEVTYRRVELDGSVDIFTADRVQLTDRFRPLKLKESVGLLASPIKSRPLTFDLRVGLGLRQVIADDQFVIDDDDATDEREVVEIESYEKAGYEFGAVFTGATEDKKITYSLSSNVLFPVYESGDDNDRSAFDKRIIDIDGKVSFYLLEWASVDYLVKVVRDPDLVSKAQVSQSLLFSINKVLVSDKKSESNP